MRTAVAVAAVVAAALTAPAASAASAATGGVDRADHELDRALEELVALPGGPPGVIALVQRGKDLTVHTAGVAERGAEAPPSEDGHVKIASVAKAFSGAVA